jgi:hypothetical protein
MLEWGIVFLFSHSFNADEAKACGAKAQANDC